MAQEMMRAAVMYDIGDIRIEEVEKPSCPRDGVLMKICYATTCGTDVKTYKRGHALHKPGQKGIFGHEASGLVAEIGPECPRDDLKVGDRIMVHDSVPCGTCYWCIHGQENLCEKLQFFQGTYCEYKAVPKEFVQKSLYKIPDAISLKVAPAVEPMSSATWCMMNADARLNDIAVVNGAGPLGLGIVRCMSLSGCRVISCDKSADRLARARKMGAEFTVLVTETPEQAAERNAVPADQRDYDVATDAARQAETVVGLTPAEKAGPRGCDIAIEAVGTPETWEITMKMARKGGKVILFGGCKPGTKVKVDCAWLHYAHITMKGVFHATPASEHLAYELIATGVLPEEILITGDGKYTLDNCVQALEDHYNQVGIKNLIKIADETL